MSESPELELLTDITRLLKKYGVETFEGLAQMLSSPDFSALLSTILSGVARTSRIAGAGPGIKKKREQSRGDFRSSLVALGESEPKKSELLVQFYDGLKAKAYLPTLRDLRGFAADAGLPTLKATTRDNAIGPLVRGLVPLGLSELEAMLSTMRPASDRTDRSLEGWSNIILDRHRRKETK